MPTVNPSIKMIKTVILIGGPSKGTRFRPLSLDVPKPLFPVAGFPLIYHHIEAASKIPNMKEIILIGSYQPLKLFDDFISDIQKEFKIVVRYLQEYTALGTAGGMYHFRDQILSGGPNYFFVINADVCGEFPLVEMLNYHLSRSSDQSHFTIMVTEATRQQSLNYGCIVEDEFHRVKHYVEKPSTFVSTLINCGLYIFTPNIFQHINTVFNEKQEEMTFEVENGHAINQSIIRLEQDIFARLSDGGCLFVFQTNKFWSQVKSASSTIYANRHYLNIYRRLNPQRLAYNNKNSAQIIGDVFIHPQATVHPTASIGPNVSIGKGAVVGPGVRIREAIILDDVVLQDHCVVIFSIVGWKSVVGEWSRIEGTPNDPNPNKPFTKIEISELFQDDGRLRPSITVIGSSVKIPSEVILLNSIVLPDKELDRSCKNQIIL